jgi:S-DNA-T family DNA segregation ATPase FtsK/SpoIIIE
VDFKISGPAFLVAGPPKSGKTEALKLIARALRQNGVRVVISHGPRSDLKNLAVEGFEVVGGSLGGVEVGSEPSVLIADDATSGFVDERELATFLDADNRAAIVAMRWEEARSIRSSSSFASHLRANSCGLLLNPVRGSSMPCLGIDVPRTLSMPNISGRGFLLDDGDVTVVQIAF